VPVVLAVFAQMFQGKLLVLTHRLRHLLLLMLVLTLLSQLAQVELVAIVAPEATA
jgi:hypothetical protein